MAGALEINGSSMQKDVFVKHIRLIIFTLAALGFFAGACFSQEQIEYKQFKLEKASCEVGVLYKQTPEGMIVGVSVIATGQGAEFRK